MNIEARINRLREIDARDKDIVQRALAGESLRQIGARYSVSHQRISEILTRENVQPNAPRTNGIRAIQERLDRIERFLGIEPLQK